MSLVLLATGTASSSVTFTSISWTTSSQLPVPMQNSDRCGQSLSGKIRSVWSGLYQIVKMLVIKNPKGHIFSIHLFIGDSEHQHRWPERLSSAHPEVHQHEVSDSWKGWCEELQWSQWRHSIKVLKMTAFIKHLNMIYLLCMLAKTLNFTFSHYKCC